MTGKLVVFGLLKCIKGYFCGIWSIPSVGLKHQQPLQSVEMVSYNVFHNPRVLVLDSIYPKIGLGVYQGEVVVTQEAITSSQYFHQWVIYKLEDHHLKRMKVRDTLRIPCILAHRIIPEIYSEDDSMGSERLNESEVELVPCKSQWGEYQLYLPLTCDDIGIYPKEDVVYQIMLKCPRLRYYFKHLNSVNHNGKESS